MLLFLNEVIVAGDGSLGSPSLMMMQCLTDAGVRVNEATAILIAGSNCGMSPGVMRPIAASMALAIRSHFQQALAAAPKPGIALHGPVQHAAVVGGAELFDRRFGDDFLPMVALGHLAGMHDQCQGTDRLNLGVPDLEVDRHRLFDLGADPATSAEGFGAADHQQAGTELLRVADQHVDLFVGERRDLIGAFRRAHVGHRPG